MTKFRLKTTTMIFAALLLSALLICVFAACAPRTTDEVRTVTFMNGDDVYETQTVKLGEKYTFPQNDPTLEQPDDDHLYSFLGWTLDPDFYEYRSELLTEPDYVVSNITIYAAYRLVAIDSTPGQGADLVYNVEFRMPRGEDFGEWSGKTLEQFTQKEVHRYSDAVLPDAELLPQIDGYHFTGEWSGGSLTNVRGNRRVTAVYEKNVYNYTWNYLGQTYTRELPFRTQVDLTEHPQVDEAFVFDGWYTDPEFRTPATLTEIPAQDVELYAKYRVDFSTATVSYEGSLVYGDIRNNLYISGLKECDDLVYTFQWTVNDVVDEPSDVRFREIKNAGDYNVAVRIFAVYKGDVLRDEGDAATEQGSAQFVYTVDKATLTAVVTLSKNSIVYGDEIPEATIVYDGFVFDETAEGVGVGQDFLIMRGEQDCTDTNLHVGAYRVETRPRELPNYKFAQIAAPTFDVTKKDLTVTATVTSNVYGDGFDYQVAFDGFVEAYNDDEQVLGRHWFTLDGDGEYVFGDRIHAGEYSAQLCGYASDDYNVILSDAVTFGVSKRSASAQITAEGGIYGVTPDVSYKLENVFAEDEDRFTPAYTYTSGGNAYNDISRFVVGNYNVTATFEERGYSDYQAVAVTGDEFEITKRPLNVTVDVQSVYTYGDTVTAKAVYENNFAFDEDENTNGLVRGEISFVWKNAEGAEYRRNNFEAGNYSVVAQGVSALNYEFRFPATQFVVNRKALVLKVHLQSDSILYGETPRVATDSGYINGIEYVGFAFDETATSVFGIAKLPQITYLDAENEATQNFHAGTYTATTSAESANYDIEVVAQSFTVNRRTLFVNVELSAQSLFYGNKPTSTIVYAAENYDGFFGNEKNIYAADAHVVYGGNQTYTQEQLNGTVKMLAGKYVVTVQGIDEGINKDYQVTYQYTVDNLTFTVERAPIQITVSAASDTYTYGVDPALTVAADKFGYGETAQELFGDGWDTVLYTKDGKPATIDGHFGAGKYHATLKDLSNDNYIITITPFDFTVNRADLTVTVSADGFKYGEQDSPVPTLKYQGFVFDENSEDLDGVARYSYARDNVLYEDSVFHAGKYAVTVAGYTSDNYEITYVGGEFDVQTRQITLTMGNGWTTYAQDPIAYNWYSIGGDEILGGESKELTFSVAITRNGGKYVQGSNKYFPHGDYVVTVTHSDNGDYTVTGDNTLTFTVAKLTYNLNVSGAKKWAERADWSATPRIPDSADRFTLQGSIVLNDPESVSAGDHSDNEIGKQFVWKNNEYHVYVGDEDVTDNFTFTYTLSVSLSNSDFAVQKPENLTFTFDGTVHTFAITATADGISADQITITYDYDGKYSQSQVSIRDVREDNYVVYYTVHAQNAEDATGSFTVIVNQADINVTAPSNITKDYDKQDSFVALKQGTNFFGVEADDEFSATVKYSKDSKDYDQDSLSIVNVKDSGTVNFLVDAGVNYNIATGFYEIAINKATVQLPEIESKTYNGNKQTAGVFATEYYDVSDVGGIDADTYQVVLALKDADNYKWSDGNEEQTRKFDFVIARAQLTRPTEDNAVYVYTAAEQTYSPDFGEQEASLFKVDNNVQTNADSYNVTVAITDKINYEWTDGKQDDIEFTFVINKADINVTVPDDVTENFNNTNRFAEVSATGVEGDDEFEPTVTYGRSDSLCDQPSLNLTNVADSGAVYFKVTAGDNYNETTGSYNVQINVAEPDIQDVTDNAEYTYRSGIVCKTQQDIYAAITQDAKNLYGDQTVEYQLNDGDFSATLPDIINAGSYTIKVKIFGDNYKEVTKTYTFTVKQRALTINAPSDISQKYNGETWNSQIAVDGLDVDDINTIAKVTYSYNSNNAYIAYSSNVAPSFTNATIGDLNVTVSVSLTDNNYSLGENGNFSGTYTVNISKAELTIPKASKEYTYDATEQNFKLDDNYDPSLMSMSGDVTGKNAQEYTMQVSLTEDAKVNYVWADSTNGIQNVSFVIKKKQLVAPTIKIGKFTYDKSPQTCELNGFDELTMELGGEALTQTNAGSYSFTVALKDKDNYEWASKNTNDIKYTFEIDKAKATLDGVSVPTISEQVNKLGKTLEDISLSSGFYWSDPSEELTVNSHAYNAYYNPDKANYENCNLTITFSTRKEKVTIGNVTNVEFDFGSANETAILAKYAISGEGGRTLDSEELALITKKLTGDIDYNIGSTYLATITISASNNYFELSGTTIFENVIVKIKSVDVGGKLYTIEDALAQAQNGTTVTVKNNSAFAENNVAEQAGYTDENYTIKNGVTLFLPCDTKNKTITEETEDYNNLFNGSNLYCSLTIKHDLVVYGKLHVNGARKNDGNDTARTDKSKGYAEINITLGVTVTLQSGSEFVCYGYAYGDGKIVAVSGSNVKEPFAMSGYKGGTISNRQYKKVFPFNQYTLANIICHLTLQQGSLYNVQACVSGTVLFSKEYYDRQLKFIGNNGDYFVEISDEGSYVEKYVDVNGYVHLETNGQVTFNNLAINAMGVTMSTQGLQVPIPGNFVLNVSSGTATIPEGVGLKLLPGAELTVNTNANLNIVGSLFAYGDNSHVVYTQNLTKWQDGNNGMAYPYTGTINAAYRTTPKLNYNATTPAKIVVAGKVTIGEQGILAADISGKDGGEVIFKGKTSGTITEDFDDYNNNKGTQGGTFTSTITCYFVHGDSSSLKATNGYYSYSAGKWNADSGSTIYHVTYKYVLTDAIGEIEIENSNVTTFTVMDVIELKDIQYSGWVFMGWYSEATCNEESRIYQIQGSCQQDIIVYGLFKQVDTYVFSYNNTQGVDIPSDMILASELEKFNPTEAYANKFSSLDVDATKDSYFDGWYLDSGCQIPYNVDNLRKQFEAGLNVQVSLYAKWSKKVTLTLKVSNGTAMINGSEYDGNKTLYYKAGSKIDLTATFEGGKSTFTISPSPQGLIQTDKTMQFDMPTSSVTITIKGKGQGCFAPGTLVTLADGTQKNVEDLVMGVDKILAFDHMTGRWTETSAFFIMHRGNQQCDTVKLYFSDGTMVHVYFGHGFFDIETNQYEIITPDNVEQYVGHSFYKVSDNLTGEQVQLVSYEVVEVYSECYSIYTGVYTDHIINGMLAVSDSLEGLYNVFELDENMKYDQAKMQQDIEQYGLFTYAEWAEYCTEEEFYLCNVQYLKVALGKGLVTMEQIYYYFTEFLAMFH